VTAEQTDDGIIVGTCSYMSPEQACARDVDARSDIFSLGIVFYEMLTGRRPFAGDSPSEVLSAIIKDVPAPVADLRPGVPRELSRLVRRCLAKEPAKRVQSALDIRNELVELRRELDSGELTAEIRGPRPSRVRAAVGVSAVAAAIAVALLLIRGRGAILPAHGVAHIENPFQLTSSAGLENHPAWAPDGGRIAYESDQNGNLDIWVVQTTGGLPVNLTSDHVREDREPAWSPDGSQIAFMSERDGGGLFLMPSIGGLPNRLSPRAPGYFTAPQWSSDGKEVAYVHVQPDATFIEIVATDTRESRRLTLPGGNGNRFNLNWSPDGRFLAYVRAPNDNAEISRIWVFRVSDGRTSPITDGTSSDWNPIWSQDARRLYFISNRRGSMDLWQQPMSAEGRAEGDAAAVTVGIGMRRAALTRDRRKLAYSKGRLVANIWRVPMLADREAQWTDAEQLTFDQAAIKMFEVLPGDRLLVSSDRSGFQNLWTMPVRGSDVRQLTDTRMPHLGPRISPDGQRIAFYSDRAGDRDLWIVPAEGGPELQLTRTPEADMFPSWSPDGTQIAFYSSRGGAVNIFVVPSTGGEPRQLTSGRSWDFYPEWSSDGRWITFSSDRDGVRRLWRVPASGGTPERLTPAPASYFRRSLDGTRIFFDAPASNDIWAVPAAGGTPRRIVSLSGRAGALGLEGLAGDDRYVYFTWQNDLGDIWIADLIERDR
jgi:Tol biopolymer transport system component